LPLQRIAGAQAFENLHKNLRRSAWPDGRKPRSRLAGIAAAMPVASFYFAPGDRILTLGSCFAREIEKHLSGLGFDLPMLKVNVPAEERITSTPNDVLNKYSVQTNLYLNGAPPPSVRNLSPERFALDVLSYDDVIQSLERIHALVRKYGAPDTKILITTSPVPFKATFTGDDALIANTYSKSVQRAACGAFAAAHDDVDYFPSYEIVTLTDRSRAYWTDNIHVNPEIVGFIMDTVLFAYCPSLGVQPKQPEEKTTITPEPTEADKERSALIGKVQRMTPAERLLQAEAAFRKGHNDKAAIIYSALVPSDRAAFSNADLGRIYTDYGVALLRAKNPERGVEILELALHYLPDDARLNYKLGLGYARIRNSTRAVHYLREALRLDPATPDHHWRLGSELIRHRKTDEARALLTEALRLMPDHAAAKRDLQRL